MTAYEMQPKPTTLFELETDPIDPHAYLRPNLRVVGGQSRSLGMVESLERDLASGHLKSLTVRHGLFGRGMTTVSGNRVKWVNNDSVVLNYTRGQFKRLPSK